MTSNDDTDASQAVFDALADEECRRIVATLDEALTASEVAEACDLPQTSTYRKLELLSDAGLVAEETELRMDGHHATRYVRDFEGVFVACDGDVPFDVDVVGQRESADQRLARYWSRISEEL